MASTSRPPRSCTSSTAGACISGVTGEDLIRETLADVDGAVEFLKPLGFGRADVVVAVPDCWIDVARMADLERRRRAFRRRAWPALPRRHQIRESDAALLRRARRRRLSHRRERRRDRGTPAAGTAELIVDITTTGTTLAANGLKILEDGVILKSEANLVASKTAAWPEETKKTCERLLARLGISAAAA